MLDEERGKQLYLMLLPFPYISNLSLGSQTKFFCFLEFVELQVVSVSVYRDVVVLCMLHSYIIIADG